MTTTIQEQCLEMRNITIQIDGKTRGEIIIVRDSGNDAVETAAKEAVAKRLEGQKIARIVMVPNRLVNFVLE